jgi:hypothetical protein
MALAVYNAETGRTAIDPILLLTIVLGSSSGIILRISQQIRRASSPGSSFQFEVAWRIKRKSFFPFIYMTGMHTST